MIPAGPAPEMAMCSIIRKTSKKSLTGYTMDIYPTKLNLDELFQYKKEQNINTVKTFNRILDRVHHKIKISSRQKNDNECCWYIVIIECPPTINS